VTAEPVVSTVPLPSKSQRYAVSARRGSPCHDCAPENVSTCPQRAGLGATVASACGVLS